MEIGFFQLLSAPTEEVSKDTATAVARPTANLPARMPEIKPFDAAVQVPSEAMRKARERLLFLQEVVQYAQKFGVSEESAALTVSKTKYDAFPILTRAGKGKASALIYTNFRNWIKQCGRKSDGMPNDGNLCALIDNHFQKEYIRPGNEGWWYLFNRMIFGGEKLPFEKAYRQARDIWNAHGGDGIPSFAQVRHYISRHFSKAALAAAREGDTWAQDNLYHIVHRSWSSVDPGEVWIGDHHKLDCYVRIWDDAKGAYRVVRPWLTAWMDARSLYFVGVQISAEAPGTTAILTALTIGCIAADWHMPRLLYSDNGADFKRMGFATPQNVGGHEHSILDRLGIRATFALPYRGRSKTIERIFKEIAEGYCKTLPTYLGSNVGDRPETASHYEKMPELAPDLLEVQEGLKAFIHEVYHRKPQKGSKILGVDDSGAPRAPVTVWRERKTFGVKWSPDALKEALLLPMRTTRKVGRGYCIRILHHDYRALNRGEDLNGHWHDDILIKEDLFRGDYYAYSIDGRFLCALEKVPEVKALDAAYDEKEAKLLAAELAHARRQAKWTTAIIKDATGLDVLVSVSDAIKLLQPGAQLVKIDTKRSVKGSTHLHAIHRVLLPGETVEDLTAPPSDTASGANLMQSTCTPPAMALQEPAKTPADDDDDVVIPKADPARIARLNELKSRELDPY